ncbi:MAG: transglycosylase family protein, partial [Actinobacteria bacterium]|nr:transglycosylase family protein [Actinomycetota bacterium]
ATAALGAPAVARPAPPARASRNRIQVASVGVAVPIGTDVWTRLARCESGGDPRAVGGRGKFFGAFQFTLASWHSVGMTGNPIDHSFADQVAAAQRLQARSGWHNWPVCARRVMQR